MYNAEYIVNEHNEVMTQEEALKWGYRVVRKASEMEAIEYERELEYWKKQGEEQQHKDSYHELPE